MNAPVKPATSPSPETLHRQFVDRILPAVELHGAVQFRHLRGQGRDDAIQETQAVAWQLFIQASELGKDPGSFPTYIAAFAVKRVGSGRRFAGQKFVASASLWTHLADSPISSVIPVAI